MTVWVIVIGGETTQSTEDKTTLFHLFHIDAIPFHPFHISTLKVGLIYIYIYKPHFQGGDVEWVEWNGIYVE